MVKITIWGGALIFCGIGYWMSFIYGDEPSRGEKGGHNKKSSDLSEQFLAVESGRYSTSQWLAYLRENSSAFNSPECVYALSMLAIESPEAAMEFVSKLGGNENLNRVLLESALVAAGNVLKSDVLKYAENIGGDGGISEGAFLALYKGWMLSDFDEAVDWGLENHASQNLIDTVIPEGYRVHGAEGLLRWVRSVSSEAKEDLSVRAFENVSARRPLLVRGLVESSFEEPVSYTKAKKAAGGSFMPEGNNPSTAEQLEFFKEYQKRIRNELPISVLFGSIRTMAESDPISTVEWVESLPFNSYKEAALSEIAKVWTQNDSSESSVWISELPLDPKYDKIVEGFSYALGQISPRDSFSWANTIVDPGRKKSTFLSLITRFGSNRDLMKEVSSSGFLDADSQEYIEIVVREWDR